MNGPRLFDSTCELGLGSQSSLGRMRKGPMATKAETHGSCDVRMGGMASGERGMNPVHVMDSYGQVGTILRRGQVC